MKQNSIHTLKRGWDSVFCANTLAPVSPSRCPEARGEAEVVHQSGERPADGTGDSSVWSTPSRDTHEPSSLHHSLWEDQPAVLHSLHHHLLPQVHIIHLNTVRANLYIPMYVYMQYVLMQVETYVHMCHLCALISLLCTCFSFIPHLWFSAYYIHCVHNCMQPFLVMKLFC